MTWDFPFTAGTLAAFRDAVNDGMAQLVNGHAGASEPATTFPRMLWADTTNLVLKMRNAADSDWDILGPLGARWDWFDAPRDFDGIAASISVPLWAPPAAAFAYSLVIQSDTATAGSSPGDEWEFQVTANGDDLLASPFITSDDELIDGVTVVPLDQNQNLVTDEDVRLVITKTGTPTDLSTAQLRIWLRAYMRGA